MITAILNICFALKIEAAFSKSKTKNVHLSVDFDRILCIVNYQSDFYNICCPLLSSLGNMKKWHCEI